MGGAHKRRATRGELLAGGRGRQIAALRRGLRGRRRHVREVGRARAERVERRQARAGAVARCGKRGSKDRGAAGAAESWRACASPPFGRPAGLSALGGLCLTRHVPSLIARSRARYKYSLAKMVKRKFEPSDELERLLLELVGMAPAPSVSPQVEDYRSDAIRLKRLADRAEGPTKYLLYVRSCLRYFEFVAVSVEGVDALATLGSTAEMVEYAAAKAASVTRAAAASGDAEELEQYAHLAVLALRLSAVARMQRFYLKSDKLKRYFDAVKAFEKARAKADKIRMANQKSGIAALGAQGPSEAELREDQGHRQLLVDSSEDALRAMEHWRAADKLLDEARRVLQAKGRKAQRLDLLPNVALVHSHEGLGDMPQAVRKSLEDIYFLSSS